MIPYPSTVIVATGKFLLSFVDSVSLLSLFTAGVSVSSLVLLLVFPHPTNTE